MPQLSEVKLRAIKPSGRIERVYDSRGLYIEISKIGSKVWRWKYHFEGKEKRLTFGPWPDVSLKDAREKSNEARTQLRQGIDPGSGNRQKENAQRTFKSLATEWMDGRLAVWSQRHTENVVERLVANVYPMIGNMPITQIEPVDILKTVKTIENRGALEVARRVLGVCSQVCRFAVAMGLIPSDPCRDLNGALKPRIKGQFAALTTPDEVGDLLVRIEEYQGTAVVRAALLFSVLTFCRPGPTRFAEWSEFDFDNRQWAIPASKMKLTKAMKLRKEAHIVPLAHQTLALLEKIKHFTGRGRYVFPNPRNKDMPMSENAINMAIRRMKYTKDQLTAHGFRSMASTLLNEAGHPYDVIEAQLAHTGQDKIRAIYNRAQYLEARCKLMQAWADILDRLKAQAISVQHS